VAGYTIAIRIVLFALLPAHGLGNAAATMVGQNLGAKNPERAERAVWTAARYNLGFLGLVGLLFAALSPAITEAFSQDPQVASTAALGLRLIALGFPFYAFGMVLTQAFNGAGDTWTPTWINLLIFWLLEIPSAWLLAIQFGLGPSGVFWAITVSYSVLALVSAALFRRGRWRTKRV
jgi:Na+-driven multidrug efflux pump